MVCLFNVVLKIVSRHTSQKTDLTVTPPFTTGISAELKKISLGNIYGIQTKRVEFLWGTSSIGGSEIPSSIKGSYDGKSVVP